MNLKAFFRSLPSGLSRVTSGGKFIREIDGLRFLAILPVVIQHTSERTVRKLPEELASQGDTMGAFLTQNGGAGVFLFFVISGFILSLPFAKMHLYGGSKVKLKKYFGRRITRLEPPYIIWMTVFLLVVLIKGMYTFSEILPHYFLSLVYLHNAVFLKYSFINPVAWSLEVEIQFYLLAPLLTWIFFREKNVIRRRTFLILSWIAMMALQQYAGWLHYPYRLFIIGHLHYFLLGFLLTDVYLSDWQGERKMHRIWDLIGIVAFGAMFATYSETGSNVIFTCCLGLLMASVFLGPLLNRMITNPWITAIGGMCYTIYLIHLPILELQFTFTEKFIVFNNFYSNFFIQLSIALAVILPASVIGFLALEKPCMDPKWPQHLRTWLTQKVSTSSKLPANAQQSEG
ncbi:MAG: acyltransferase [Bacteroidota bacterium]